MSEVGRMYMNEELDGQVIAQDMTVYSALNKRKIYLDKLNKLSSSGTPYCDAVQANAVDINGMTIEAFTNKCKSNYDKGVAILRNFFALNAAITVSNALTHLTIGERDYTVTEAIVRYDRLNAETEFLNNIAKSVANAQAMISKQNADKLSERAISDYVVKMLANCNMQVTEANAQDEQILNLQKRFREDYIAANTYQIIDPYDLSSKIEAMMDELREFRDKFNEAINICNMQTVITVDLIND